MNKIIKYPMDCVSVLSSLSKKKNERFGIICLDMNGNMLSKKILSIGCDDSCVFRPREIFWEACKKKASAIILFHNHPSGNCTPSTYDISTTNKIQKACNIIGIPLLDHIIVGKTNYFSFHEHDMIKLNEEEKVNVAAPKYEEE